MPNEIREVQFAHNRETIRLSAWPDDGTLDVQCGGSILGGYEINLNLGQVAEMLWDSTTQRHFVRITQRGRDS